MTALARDTSYDRDVYPLHGSYPQYALACSKITDAACNAPVVVIKRWSEICQ